MNDDTNGLPLGWSRASLGDVGRYLNGRAFKKSEWAKTGRPIIRIQDLTKSVESPNYFDGEVEDRYVVRPGDFLVSWSATLGAFIWQGPEGVLNQHIFKVESGIDQRFHYHLVRFVLGELQLGAHGSGMEHVTKGVFDATPVLIPPLAEQKRIAARVDELDERVEESRQRLQRVRSLVDQYKRGVLTSACVGKLTDGWYEALRSELPSVQDALANAPTRKRRGVNDSAGPPLELPELPSRYLAATIGEAAVILEYGTSRKATAAADAGIAVLRMGNIQEGQLDLDDLKFVSPGSDIDKLMLADGDLLFNRTNSPELVGKSAVFHATIPATLASYLIRVRFASDVASADFVNMWLNSAWGRVWARYVKTDGVSQSNINGTKLAAMPLPLPPLEEQLEAVRRAEIHLSAAVDVLRRVAVAEMQLSRLTRSVLAKAFRGELVDTEHDLAATEKRDYEPAEQLLARVSAQHKSRGARARTRPRVSTR